MGLFSTVERRTSPFPYPTIPSNSQLGSSSIRSVSLARADAALAKVAIFASVNLLASTAEQLPGGVFRGKGVDRQTVKTPSWLLDLGGDGQGTDDFQWQMVYCWGLRGNVVGQVAERDTVSGQPRTIDLKHPDDVTVTDDPVSGLPTWRVKGNTIPADQIWHKRVYPIPGRTLGLSPIALHATTISQGLYAQNFGAQWFLDGATPSAILTNKTAREIDQTVAQTVKDRFISAVRGTREPVVLGSGWEYQQIQIAAAESQFLETQNLTSAECARIYGPGMPEILGYQTGNSMTYANIGQRAVDLLKYTVNPWLVRIEKAISSLLPQPQYWEFDRNALLETDAFQRMQKHVLALKNGLQPINEIRANEEHLPPVPWGYSPYLPALGPAAAAAAVTADAGETNPSTGATPDPNAGDV